jgi:hypothetical protein
MMTDEIRMVSCLLACFGYYRTKSRERREEGIVYTGSLHTSYGVCHYVTCTPLSLKYDTNKYFEKKMK